jgi:hypothetical protein
VELAESVGPMLEEALSEQQVAELCIRVARMFKGGRVDESNGAGTEADDGTRVGASEAAGEGGDKYLVKCENIIMAFAGRVLLKKRQEEIPLPPLLFPPPPSRKNPARSLSRLSATGCSPCSATLFSPTFDFSRRHPPFRSPSCPPSVVLPPSLFCQAPSLQAAPPCPSSSFPCTSALLPPL